MMKKLSKYIGCVGLVVLGMVIGVSSDFQKNQAAQAIGISVEDASMRDLFAGMAVTGLLAGDPHFALNKNLLATEAYKIADEVLRVRKAKK